jgi:hypothetical protein
MIAQAVFSGVFLAATLKISSYSEKKATNAYS